jgi:Acetyltransferase (GNAT) domain
VDFALHTRYHARPYAASDRPAWDAFVRSARNGVFLFERAYLDYHAARYQDASLMLSDESGQIAALLPAQREADNVVSHGGLSFGGLVMHPRGGASAVLGLFEAVVDALRHQGTRHLIYRPVPHIYHRLPSEDDLYALHRLGARTVRVDLSTTIDLARRPPLSKGRRHALAKARRAGVEVHDHAGLPTFWRLLDAVLAQRHGVRPTHSLAEMEALVRALPGRIVFCGAWRGESLLGGTVLYRYDGVLHTQYLACDDEGRACGALDLVIEHALAHHAQGCRWLNFGISTAEQGRVLNTGLLAQKEMFGGRSTVLQTLELAL